MLATLLDAKAKLEAEGLHVSCSSGDSLWIAANVRDAGEGIKISEDACSLLRKSNRWVVVFPAEGLFTYEVPGSLSDLVAVIAVVYASYRQMDGSLKDAFKHVVTEAASYLVGPSPAHV